jgi:hypothetical protein
MTPIQRGTPHRDARSYRTEVISWRISEATMGRGLLLWLLGIPLPIILIIWLLGGLHS